MSPNVLAHLSAVRYATLRVFLPEERRRDAVERPWRSPITEADYYDALTLVRRGF